MSIGPVELLILVVFMVVIITFLVRVFLRRQ